MKTISDQQQGIIAQRQNLNYAVLTAAQERGVLAPIWEINTAKIQANTGQSAPPASVSGLNTKAGNASQLIYSQNSNGIRPYDADVR